MPSIHPKVAASGLAGSITVLIVWAIGLIPHAPVIPPDVASAFTTVISLFTGYLTPSGAGSQNK